MSRGYKAGVRGGGGIIPPGPVVPDGKTVTPINDIPTWLKCAGIPTTTYTTLTEVLADTSLLRMLINSENAMDYLVRCKEWIKQEALVPTMTSNTTPSGIASASTHYNQREAYKAFDGNLTYPNYWGTSSGKGWVQYQFTTSKVLKCVKLLQQVSGTSGWTMEDSSVKVQGSNDGTNFTDIEEITLLSSEATSWKTISINNSTAYTYIRLNFNSTNMFVSGVRYSVIGEAQFYNIAEEGVADNATAMKYIGANDYASNLLLSDEDWREGICNSEYVNSVMNIYVPKMTSNNAPEGLCFANRSDGTYPYYAFDQVDSTGWISTSGTSGDYIGYQFTSEKRIVGCSILFRNTNNNVDRSISIQASDGVNTYTEIGTGIVKYNSIIGKQSLAISNNNTYKSFRIVFADPVYSSGNYNAYVAELQFYGRHNGGVQSWLLSAGITNKAYTSLSEVFSDTETLRVLLNNHDAVYYLTTVPGWVKEFAANETAMKYIGANDYASDILLANEEWVDAIANSTYYTKILNTAVPTMTSDTTPSGEVITSSNASGFEGYKAFDEKSSTSWRVNSTILNGSYIIYHFTEQVSVHRVVNSYNTGSGSIVSSTVWELYGSNDNVTYTDIGEVQVNGADAVANLLNSNEYTYYKLQCKSPSTSSNTTYGFASLQFYGRITGGAQSWLLAAGITNKNYTTVAQVLADSDLLPVLIASHSGMDYLATCVAFANEICANETAMQLIGADNYAADTLLADETWLNAICNSTYFESVLNVKVPTMTSDSLPSGTCAADSISSAESASFKAFDNDATTFWSSNPTDTPGQHYNGYTFTSPQKIKMVEITSFKNAQSSSDFEIKIASHDGGIWTDVSDTFTFANTADSTTRKFAFVNDTAYSNYTVKYPVDCTAYYGQYIAQVRTLQFYGRQDV